MILTTAVINRLLNKHCVWTLIVTLLYELNELVDVSHELLKIFAHCSADQELPLWNVPRATVKVIKGICYKKTGHII